jgi:hypothetical protein
MQPDPDEVTRRISRGYKCIGENIADAEKATSRRRVEIVGAKHDL